MTDTIPTPTDQDWEAFDTYRACGDSASEAARRLGIPREEVVERMMRASTWLRVSGWREAFEEALKIGMGLSDARERADQVAAYNMRAEQ